MDGACEDRSRDVDVTPRATSVRFSSGVPLLDSSSQASSQRSTSPTKMASLKNLQNPCQLKVAGNIRDIVENHHSGKCDLS